MIALAGIGLRPPASTAYDTTLSRPADQGQPPAALIGNREGQRQPLSKANMDTSTSTPKRKPSPPSTPPKTKESRRNDTSIDVMNDDFGKLDPPSAIKAKKPSAIDISNDTVNNTNDIDFNNINNITLQSIEDEIIKPGSNPKKGEPSPTCVNYTIVDDPYTEDVAVEVVSNLEKSISSTAVDNTLSILNDIINKFPNQPMVSTKCALAIITLQQQDLTQEQSRKLFNMLLRCKLCNDIDPRSEGSTTTIEVKEDGADTTTH